MSSFFKKGLLKGQRDKSWVKTPLKSAERGEW